MNSNIIRRSVFDGFGFAFLALVVLAVVFSPDEEQLLNLKMNFQIFLASFGVGAIFSYVLNHFGIRTLGELLFEAPDKKIHQLASPWYAKFWCWQLMVLFAVTFLVALEKTQFSFVDLFDEYGFQGAVRLFQGVFQPNWEILPEAVLNIIETIFMAFLATVLAIPFAFILSFLAAKNIMTGRVGFGIYVGLRTLLNVTRSVEALIWAIIFSVWVGIGPFAGMLALMIHSIASLTKQYSEMVESVQEGPIEGIMSTGANRLQTIWFAVVPQVILPYISFTVYRWDINVRMATIIGLVGGGGIGTMLIQYQGQAMWPEVGCIIFVIAVVVWLLDAASAYIREALK